MKKRSIIIVILLLTLLAACSTQTYEIAVDSEATAELSLEPTVEPIVPFVEEKPSYTEISYGSGNPVRCDLREEEIDALWSMYKNLEFVSDAERGDEEKSYSILFFIDETNLLEKISCNIYENNIVYIIPPEGEELIYSCEPGCLDYALIKKIYENRRVVHKSNEDIASAIKVARTDWEENGSTIDRLWYDEICASAETTWDVSRNNLSGGNWSEDNFIVLYMDYTRGSDDVFGLPYEKRKNYMILLTREIADAEWTVLDWGKAPGYVDRCVEGGLHTES